MVILDFDNTFSCQIVFEIKGNWNKKSLPSDLTDSKDEIKLMKRIGRQ